MPEARGLFAERVARANGSGSSEGERETRPCPVERRSARPGASRARVKTRRADSACERTVFPVQTLEQFDEVAACARGFRGRRVRALR